MHPSVHTLATPSCPRVPAAKITVITAPNVSVVEAFGHRGFWAFQLLPYGCAHTTLRVQSLKSMAATSRHVSDPFAWDHGPNLCQASSNTLPLYFLEAQALSERIQT
ncbi:hypothetical protein SCLCIDRAFT_1213187 [Scleroderma citrinum Foug A]|uniref:Uncharacterized protein n=1 Tax=Scleroderma citrinum Foug A TaxID=1036808 RepID=A0A0C3E8G4_9AGAM|nr:hypothetical protein SCLCIDRAFT_1213187 [Scleroderma citrinum Foug A]